MSKWRPSSENIYVVGDIHGKYSALKLILNRILPLRKQDLLIFLGDYVDRGPHSYLVINELIKLSNKYNNVICLLGNHEWLFMASTGITNPLVPAGISPAQVWLTNGGVETIVDYAQNAGLTKNDAMHMSLNRIQNIVPQDHQQFMLDLKPYYELDKYKFVHAGCDPNSPLENQSNDILLWNTSLWNFVSKNKGKGFSWDKTIVCAHNHNGPFISDKYIMIDTSVMGKIMCFELNSRTGFLAAPGKSRMVMRST